MKLFLLVFFFLLLTKTQAQPKEQTSTFQFRLFVDPLGFTKGQSNVCWRKTSPTVSPGQAITRFQKKDFKGDTLFFELTVQHQGFIRDTLAFELLHDATSQKMVVALSAIPNPALSYQIDLKQLIHNEQNTDPQVFFDLVEINALLEEQDSLSWHGCLIQQTAVDNHHKKITIQVENFGFGKTEGLFLYSYKKIQAGGFENPYAGLNVKHFLVADPNSLSGQLIHPAYKLTETAVVAKYYYLPTSFDKRNKLFGHQAIYTFYDNNTFVLTIYNPPTVVSLMEPRQDGFGIWEVDGNNLVLITPPHWLKLFDAILYETSPIYTTSLSIYQIKGNLLLSGYNNQQYRLKRKKVKGQYSFKAEH